MTDRELMQQALDALEHGLPIIEDFGGKEQLQLQHKAIAVLYEALRARLEQPEPEPTRSQKLRDAGYTRRPKGWDKDGEEPEPVAWRTFDGEGGYEYRDYETNESYASEWAQRNPNHKGWVEPLYKDPTPCQTCESLARTVMMDQVSYDAPPRHREPPTQDLSAPLTVNGVPMYPQREWQGLTTKDLAEIPPSCFEGAIWADAKLKEKNT